MAEEKIDVEVLQKLEEEIRNKMATMQKMLGDLQAESAISPEELLKKMGDVEDVKVLADAVKEMQDKIKEKKVVAETALGDIQKELESLKAIKEKVKEKDVTDELKSIAVSMRDKKEILEKTVEELEALRGEYNKRFFEKG